MKEVLTQLTFFPTRYLEGFFRRFETPIILILFTFLRLKRPLRWGKEIYPLDFSTIRELVRNSLYKKDLTRKAEGPAFFFEQWQLITPANCREEKLLSQSLKFFVPHEVCQIVVKTKSGDMFESSVCHGLFFSFGDSSRINRMIIKTLRTNDIEKSAISKIDIIHTHPSIDFILETNKQESFLYLNALSKSDLNMAGHVSKQWNNLITIKAVTHSQLSFAATYFQGKILDY